MRTSALLVLTTLLASTPAQAQTFMYDFLCSTGSVGACFSLAVATTATATGTDVQMSLQNHQGTPGFSVPQPVGLTQVSFWNVFTGQENIGQATMTGNAVGAATPWTWRTPFFDPGGRLQLIGAGFGADSPLVGCGVPSGVGSAYYQSCGLGSTLNLAFSLPFLWTPPTNQGVTFSYIADVPGGGGRCDVNASSGRGTPTCVAMPPPVSVPEPGSALLVASGLLAMVGLGRRRGALEVEDGAP